VNEKFYGGIRFNIIGPLSFYTNKEINWVNERYYATRSRPNAWESGLEYGRHFGSKRPASLNLRMVYRDEEDTGGNISFLSGEDYLEGYSELRWRPVNDTELYGSCRIRNVWADNPQVNKRIEADFNAGLRYTWDTGFYWDSVGSIEGYVFKDLNSDGLRQRNDPPIEGVKVYLGKDNSTVTDIFGYFVFRKVKGKKAFVSIDTSAIPQGYVLTVPSSKEVSIMQGGRAQVNFGLTSHTEIRGVAFEDIDQDMQHSPNDVGLMGITVFLDDSRETTTDAFGRFSFGEVLPGDHIIRLDLNSLPRAYLPKISLKQKVTVIEGATVFQNFPMKKSAD
jgi:hypothetical protein